MNRNILIVLILFAAVTFSQQQFTSSEYSFSMTFPDLWSVEKGTQSMVGVVARLNTTTSINVIVQENDKYKNYTVLDVDILNFRNELEGKYKNYFKNFNSIDCGRTTVNEYSAIYFIYECDFNNEVLYAKQYFLFRGDKIYVISTGCLKSEYSNFFEIVFNECLNSLKFID